MAQLPSGGGAGSGMDNRRHVRVRVAASACLELPAASVSGRVVDLSFGGAFLETSGSTVATGAEGRLLLQAEGSSGPIVFTCRVVRVTGAGLGLRLLETDPAGYERFADLVRDTGGVGDLVDEWRVSPGFSVATREGQKRALD